MVVEEYLRRTGGTKLSKEFFRTYPLGRMLVELLIRKIALETCVPKYIVLEALIQGSYKGISLMNSELSAEIGKEARSLLDTYKYLDKEGKNYESEALKLCQEFIKTVNVEEVVDPAILGFLRQDKWESPGLVT